MAGAVIKSMRKPGDKALPQEALDMMGKMKPDRNDQ